jgi:hypothetical protein
VEERVVTRPSLPRAAALAIATLPACVLYDDRAVTIAPDGTLHASDGVVLRVSAPSPEVSLELDGRVLPGTWPTDRWVRVPLGVPDGRHRLVARATSGTLPASAARDVEVDWTPFELVSVDPAPGTIVVPGELRVHVAFTSRVEVGLATTAFAGPPGRPHSNAPVTIDPDARGVTVTAPGPVTEAFGEVDVHLLVRAAGELPTREYVLGVWRAPAFSVAVTSPASGARAGGPIRFVASASGEVPDRAELVAGDRVLASLGPPPWDVELDPLTLPDGVHQLAVRAPGYRVDGRFPEIVVDSTLPRVVSCAPSSSPPDQASASDCVTVTFSEQVFGPLDQATLVVRGVPRPTSVRDAATWAPSVSLCPTAAPDGPFPFVESVSLPALADTAGNPVAPFTCEITVRAWPARYGATVAGLAADDAVVWTDWSELVPSSVVVVPRGAARVQRWAPQVDGWRVVATLSSEPGTTASDLTGGAWIERAGSGPGHVHTSKNPGVVLNADTGEDARRPTADDGVAAWSEVDPAGGRRVRMKRWRFPDAWVDDLGSPPRLAPASVADAPAVGTFYGEPRGGVRHLLPWIETAPAGVPKLRAADAFEAWTLVPELVNQDASAPVVDVAVGMGYAGDQPVVAWQEGDRVVATSRPADGLDPFPTPAILNVDPSAPARLPRVDRWSVAPTVFFVERSAAGDEIWARRWNGASWELLPGPVNEGAEGTTIRELDVRVLRRLDRRRRRVRVRTRGL